MVETCNQFSLFNFYTKNLKYNAIIHDECYLKVKFVSRRIKAQVMKARTKLKDNPYLDAAHKPAKVFLCDDLTKRRAHLAFLARKLKQDSVILDTWVFDSRIFVKDKHNRVTRINNEQDLRKF